MDYNFAKDLQAIRSVLDISQNELAKHLGVEQVTLSRSEQEQTRPSEELLMKVYTFAFDKNIIINHLKEMLWTEEMEASHRLLFHGAKGEIKGKPDIQKSRLNNDFGQGFYTGENYEQAVSFVAGFEKSSVYFMDFNPEGLDCKKYKVDRDWMMTIAYYRGRLQEYSDHPVIKALLDDSRACDYIVAPIADNRMFQIINSFIEGELTDEQCKHCLAATNLGMQYVFISDRAMRQVALLERCYLAGNERKHYMSIRSAEAKDGRDKVKLAKVKYRGKGRYIDEILG